MRAAPLRPCFWTFSILLLASATLLPATAVQAGFYVDDFEVGEAGSCSVESSLSYASNKDFMAATSPSCVFQLGAPVEIGTEVQRSRENGERKTSGGISGKVTLVRMTKGIGIGLSGETKWNLITGASTGGNINVPVSFDIGKSVRLNVNGGYLYDAPTQAHFGTWASARNGRSTPKWR